VRLSVAKRSVHLAESGVPQNKGMNHDTGSPSHALHTGHLRLCGYSPLGLVPEVDELAHGLGGGQARTKAGFTRLRRAAPRGGEEYSTKRLRQQAEPGPSPLPLEERRLASIIERVVLNGTAARPGSPDYGEAGGPGNTALSYRTGKTEHGRPFQPCKPCFLNAPGQGGGAFAHQYVMCAPMI
jgi:hypothetical protein